MTHFNAQTCAEYLYEASKTGQRLAALPPDAMPHSDDDVQLVQDEVARLTGPVCAWKVGAASAQARPSRAPIHARTLFLNSAHIPASMFTYIGAEAEIAYKFAHDLPSTGTLTRMEVLNAVESVHPAIEIIDTRFLTLNSQPKLAHQADQGNHGALIIGDPIANWRSMNPIEQRVVLTINGEIVSDKVNGNSAGNPEDLLVWLANIGARSLGGIKAGQYVTTGSCSGTIMVTAPVQITASLSGRGDLSLKVS